MRNLITFALLGIAALVLLCGCPRDTGGDTGAAMVPPSATDATGDAAHGEPAATDTSGGLKDETGGKGGPPPADDDKVATDEETADEMAADDGGETAEDTELGEEMSEEQATEETITVVFETTKGDIVLEVHPSWSPLGAAHFIELVEAGFYDGAPWFRVIPGFVAQCGVAADPALNVTWGEETILDEPVRQGNLPGYVAFGKSAMPNSRSTHIFINYIDNSGALDSQGFSCFAQVVEGFDNARELFPCEFGDQAGLGAAGGLDRFRQAYPNADYITRAYLR
jgi:cyclophilin family peptidyl-prolyl cis-trans isomerase